MAVAFFVSMSMGVGLFSGTQVTYDGQTTEENDSSYPTAINVHGGMLTGTILCIHHAGYHDCNEFMSSMFICCSSVNTILQLLVTHSFLVFFIYIPPVSWGRGNIHELSSQQSNILNIFDQYRVCASTIIY
jgi:phosphotransferase system  glucose/maltose/N-acetylglucosamine-specific IIC component